MSYYSEATAEVFTTIMGAAQGVSDILNSVKRTKNTAGYLNRSSIMKAAQDLVMSFPVLCADTISPSTASMIVKAIERNCVTTLQLLFSAANLQGEDGMQVLQMWHKNMDTSKNMDDWLDAADAISLGFEESGLLEDEQSAILEAMANKYAAEMVREFQSSCSRVFPESSFSENSLMQFSVRESYGGKYNVYTREDHCSLTAYNESIQMIDEGLRQRTYNGMGFPDIVTHRSNDNYNLIQINPGAIPGVDSIYDIPSAFVGRGEDGGLHVYADQDSYNAWYKEHINSLERSSDLTKNQADYYRAQIDKIQSDISSKAAADRLQNDRFEWEKLSSTEKAKKEKEWRKEDQEYQKQRDQLKDQLDNKKLRLDQDKFDHQQRQDALRNLDAQADFFHKQLLPSDVKKANEMVPSMMIVRFNAVTDINGNYAVQPNYQQFIAGVKARLIAVSSMEIIDAIRSLEKNKVNFTNLVRATTKEISFCRDFVAGIEQAKIDAKRNSRLSKTSPIWRSLQWRSSKSVMNRLRRHKANDAGAITTLVLTSEEVNFMKSEYNIDLNIPAKARSVMEAYNLMCLCIVDEEVEVARFLFDGDKYFQDFSFSALERETGDSSYKKIINLMSKMNR